MSEYEKYKLQWMIEHDYTIGDLLENLAKVIGEEMNIGINPSAMIDEAMELFEDNYGFNQNLWMREDEWKIT